MATDVDHIIPHKGDRSLLYDERNLQALCHECHSRKTFFEDGGFGRRKVTNQRQRNEPMMMGAAKNDNQPSPVSGGEQKMMANGK